MASILSAAEEADEAPAVSELAELFPGFEILGLVGRGGMGFVYRAHDRRLGRDVALKLLRPELANDASFVERFEREARTLARLDEPFAVSLLDFGRAGSYSYLVLEFVEGRTLRAAISDGLSPREAVRVMARVAEAVEHAHDQGVIHRDLKPENILLDRYGTPRLGDFGLAKLLDEDGRHSLLPGLTKTHQVLGSLCYLAPELQLQGAGAASTAADVYAMGVVLYEALTGSLPLGRFPAPSETRGVDAALDAVALAALERDPALRPSATVLRGQLEDWLARPESRLQRALESARDAGRRAGEQALDVGRRASEQALDVGRRASEQAFGGGSASEPTPTEGTTRRERFVARYRPRDADHVRAILRRFLTTCGVLAITAVPVIGDAANRESQALVMAFGPAIYLVVGLLARLRPRALVGRPLPVVLVSLSAVAWLATGLIRVSPLWLVPLAPMAWGFDLALRLSLARRDQHLELEGEESPEDPLEGSQSPSDPGTIAT